MPLTLPDEIWASVLEYLDPHDILAVQQTCQRLFKLGRDNSLWRWKCFEKAPSASSFLTDRPDALAALTGALSGLSLSGSPPPQNGNGTTNPAVVYGRQYRASRRAKAVAAWDHAGTDERIDWYSEYTARHAPISIEWASEKESPQSQDVRGIVSFDQSSKAIACLEDGAISIWDIQEHEHGRRKFRKIHQTRPGLLFRDYSSAGQSSRSVKHLTFTGVVECVSVDSHRNKAYIAVDKILNEVDLNTSEVVTQNTYAWPITALSQETSADLALSVGTSWSLHLYDPRAPMRDRSRSPEDLLRSSPGNPEESIAFLPNYEKDKGRISSNKTSLNHLAALSQTPSPLEAIAQAWPGRRSSRRAHLSDYAHMEPGPLSILHHNENDIFIAGRFPSVLSYDRRYFPRLQYPIHSGARLSAMTIIPQPPKAIRDHSDASATLVICGEYGGRGSLELCSLPYQKSRPPGPSFSSSPPSQQQPTNLDHPLSRSGSNQDQPYHYKNRQEASSSKLLSVATHGSRIVFSDAEGGLKWVERDGRGLARRWNINSWQVTEQGASLTGEQVVRKIVPLDAAPSDCGDRGDNDLLIWTGEKMGIVTTKPQWADHEELVNAFELNVDLSEQEEEEKKAEEYGKAMRRALERQADERRWMSQFRLKRGL